MFDQKVDDTLGLTEEALRHDWTSALGVEVQDFGDVLFGARV
ncbi:MAG TPA: hypothetical protein VF173_11255 [Thermoanaerobaculia bacterium]|nr:hypothetical protein [Thermoanaerobaculia bacterium]